MMQKQDGIVSEKELLAGKGVDQINLFKLIRYLSESKLARKVESYAVHVETEANTSQYGQMQTTKTQASSSKPELTTSPVLHTISTLLSALTNPSKEGRLFFTKSPTSPDQITLSYLLLDPSTSFSTIVSQARAVLLAGGTMSPFSDYTTHLFPTISPSQIITLSCGHVIPSSNLLAWTLSKGPSGREFNFTFKNRQDNEMIDELGGALLNICSVVPDGVVVFFPSYAYLSSILSRWETSLPPSNTSLLSRLKTKKALFKESKEESVETVLTSYAQAIDSGQGGLLLSVVGGKMSEGINFSDSLGRCVVIVGLPFPNINSTEWKAKIEYIESATIDRLSSPDPSQHESGLSDGIQEKGLSKEEVLRRAKEQGREFYENACMRAVNQSVGRAIRHKGDYAAIVMIDSRFGGERIKGKLPGWIQGGLVEGAAEKNFGSLMGALGGFFRGKKGL
jgi:chromosome transmission fidelity protein 1